MLLASSSAICCSSVVLFALFAGHTWARLNIDAGCAAVPGSGDMRNVINDDIFYLVQQIALYAAEQIDQAVYHPHQTTPANVQRIFQLLAAMTLPNTNSRFHRTADGLIGTLAAARTMKACSDHNRRLQSYWQSVIAARFSSLF